MSRHDLVVHAVRLAAAAVVVVLIIVALPDLGAMRRRLARTAAGWVTGAVALEAASVAAFAVAFRRTFRADVNRRTAAALAFAAQGVNVLVPAGGMGGMAAIGVVMPRLGLSADYVVSRLLALFLLTSALTNVGLVIVGGFGTALGRFGGHIGWALSLVPAVLATALATALVAVARGAESSTSDRESAVRDDGPQGAALPATPGPVARAIAWTAERVRDGLRASLALLTTGDIVLLAGASCFVLLDLGALAASFAAVGSGGLPLGPLLLAYTLGQIGSIVSLPGTTEGGLLGVLALYGAPLSVAAAVVVIYRAVQIVVPLLLGVVGAAGLRGLLAEREQPGGIILGAPPAGP